MADAQPHTPDPRFEFAAAGTIVFGAGSVREISRLAPALGRRPLVVTGRSPVRAEIVLGLLHPAGMPCAVFSVGGEPAIEDIRRGVAAARDAGCDMVVAIGGGSAIDAGKAIAALMTNGGDPLDYLEVIGRSQPLRNQAAPVVAVPTTAGTGSEVTRNAVLTVPDLRVKASLRSPLMLPRAALVDPEMTLDLPPAVTASTGLDALTQLIEPFLSLGANPITDACCLAGLERASRSLERACEAGRDLGARSDMSLASLFGGLALANAGLGAVHGFAAAIGGMFPAPHGAVCAACLPHVMEVNFHALREREPSSPALGRMTIIARILTGDRDASPDDSVRWLRGIVERLRIPALAAYGVSVESVPALVAQAGRSSSMRGNPLPLTPSEMQQVLLCAL
jgi:alcohol dehydrogenase class IV